MPSRRSSIDGETSFPLVQTNGSTTASAIRVRIETSGICADDFRLSVTMERLRQLADQPIDFACFVALVGEELLMLNRTFMRQLVIPDWQEFRADIEMVHHHVSPERSGRNAACMPILRDADSEQWGVVVCSVDGQRVGCGDVDVYHPIRSVSRPLTDAQALRREGGEFTHQFVRVEPSGPRVRGAAAAMPDRRPAAATGAG